MSTSQTLLALLEAEPAHGYTLKQRHDEWFTRAKPLAFGQVYAALARFEKRGLAAGVEIGSEGGPGRRHYTLTAEGVAAVTNWVATPEPATAYSSSTLFAKVSVALMSGRDAGAVLQAQREAHLVRMRELTRTRRDAGPAAMLEITFELNHLDADLRWIEEAGERLPGMVEEGLHG